MRDVKILAQQYVSNLNHAIKTLKVTENAAQTPLPFMTVLDSALRYSNDAKYFLDKNDSLTAITSASYSEGLLDALRILNIIEVNWKTRFFNNE